MADVRNSGYPTPGMDAHQPSFGAYLRRWRRHRRMTQMELAVAADSSTQHLSYLETGRAQPSREMVMRLAEHLEVPLRERNTMLLSGGFAPAFQQRSLTELKSACLAIAQVLQTHKPYPAFAVDRYWNIVLSNEAIPQLYVDVAPELLRQPNAVRLMLHPRGLAPRVISYAEWRSYVVTVLRRQIAATTDPGVEALLNEVLEYPLPIGTKSPAPTDKAERYATPLQIATDEGILSFLSTTTIFGTPIDVTLSELALEMLFPADAETITIVRKLAANEGYRLWATAR